MKEGRLMNDHDEEAARHTLKMQKRKALFDKQVAARTQTKGLLMVHTGPGKGKSSAAFGVMTRMLGHKKKVAVVQFIKGGWESGERAFFEQWPEWVYWHSMGEGFTWETQDKDRDKAACAKAWQQAQIYLRSPEIALLVLDELNIALRYDYLSVEQVMEGLMGRIIGQHVVVTGRNAPAALIEVADMVTEMGNIRHHAKAGIQAQEGIEF